MKTIDILLTPVLAFLIFLAVSLFIYWLGGRMAPKLRKIGGKLTTYACGEDLPGVKIQWGYRLFFFIALFFTIMHVASLVVATLPSGPIVLFGIFYLAMIFLSILALVTRS